MEELEKEVIVDVEATEVEETVENEATEEVVEWAE